METPINEGNHKLIVFTAFADTAEYLYKELAPWAKETFGVYSAVVTGARKTHPIWMGSVLLRTAFCPISPPARKNALLKYPRDGK